MSPVMPCTSVHMLVLLPHRDAHLLPRHVPAVSPPSLLLSFPCPLMPHVTYASCGLPDPSINDRTFVCALCPQRLHLKYAVSGQHPNQYYLKVCCIFHYAISPCLIGAYAALVRAPHSRLSLFSTWCRPTRPSPLAACPAPCLAPSATPCGYTSTWSCDQVTVHAPPVQAPRLSNMRSAQVLDALRRHQRVLYPQGAAKSLPTSSTPSSSSGRAQGPH